VTFNTTGNQTLTATATQAIAGTSITPTGTSTDVTVTGSATSGISITPPKNPYGFKAPAGGQQIVLNFTVMPSGATGTVTVVDNTTGDVVGTGTVSSGTATVPIQRLGVGQHDLTAQYSGDGTYRAATTDTQVNQSPAPEIKGNPPPK
jgi:hypothetical protein